MNLEDDFADLDAIISEVETRRSAKGNIASKYKKLAGSELTREARQILQSEVEIYERLHVWLPTASVALFDSQVCETCQHKHRFFKGWFESQQHRTDPNCKRLVRGKSVDGTLPLMIEEVSHGKVEMCGDCAESGILIEQHLASAARLAADQEAAAILNAAANKRESMQNAPTT